MTKEKAEKIISKTRNTDLASKIRDEHKQSTQSNRFKIVNCTRPVHFEEDKKFTVVDIEKHTDDDNQASTSSVALTTSPLPSTSSVAAKPLQTPNDAVTSSQSHDENNYVYDVYLPDDGADNIDDNLIENILRFVMMREMHFSVRLI